MRVYGGLMEFNEGLGFDFTWNNQNAVYKANNKWGASSGKTSINHKTTTWIQMNELQLQALWVQMIL